jgi:1-acyl-sn-glycerol-3-phosphate acyltransferase
MGESVGSRMTQASSLETYHLPARFRLNRALLRPVFRGLFRLLATIRISGQENIPVKGSYIIAINHVSLYEAPFILAFWPIAPEAMGAVDIWSRHGQSTLVRLYGGIPVHRGEYDRRVLETILSALSSGRPLLIAPEGGRSHTLGMRRALPGVAYAAYKTGVPIVPVGIAGATDDFLKLALLAKRPGLEMRIGIPINLPAVVGRGEERRRNLQKNADLIMYQIAALLPTEYRGVYAGKHDTGPARETPLLG